MTQLANVCPAMQGQAIPGELFGPLHETEFRRGGELLRERMQEDGYVFLRGVLDVAEILAAREEVFSRLAAVGEIRTPAIDGIATGTSQREELCSSLGEFWKSVSEGPALRRVTHAGQICDVMNSVFGEPSRAHDYLFLRPGVVGRSTRLHFDHPFFARGSSRICTVWTALGDIPLCDGPLAVVEGSHRFEDLIAPVRDIDYDSKDSPPVQMTGDVADFLRERNTRLLASEFRAGDLIVFSMTLLHGSLDNQSPIGRTRLSCDVRWQPTTDPVDPRYSGPDPKGTTGIGYGELNGAKPLTVDWHTR